MTPEFIAFLVIAFYMLAAVILLSFGGWLVRHDLSRNASTRASRITEDLRPFQNLVVDIFARAEPCARLLSVLVRYGHPLRVSAAFRNATSAAERGGNGDATLSASEWLGLGMMRLAGLIRFNKQGVVVTNVGREVHRRITILPRRQKPRRESIYDSLFVPLPMDTSHSAHQQRMREALQKKVPEFVQRNRDTVKLDKCANPLKQRPIS
jgi:hypothetical protein